MDLHSATPPPRPNFGAAYGSEEFVRQAATYTLDGARGVLKSLQSKRKLTVAPYDLEIAFVENVIKYKEENN